VTVSKFSPSSICTGLPERYGIFKTFEIIKKLEFSKKRGVTRKLLNNQKGPEIKV